MKNEENRPNYQWRIATRGDVGSVARFRDSESDLEDWTYGILKDVISEPDSPFRYVIAEDYYNRDGEKTVFCEVQYDANKEP